MLIIYYKYTLKFWVLGAIMFCLFVYYVLSIQSSSLIYKEHMTVCNFQSMKSLVELNSLFLKLFRYITWFE